MKENDIKYKMVRLRKPSWASQVDADYFKNTESFERLVNSEEQLALAIQKANQEVQQSVKDAETAKERLKGRKRHSPGILVDGRLLLKIC